MNLIQALMGIGAIGGLTVGGVLGSKYLFESNHKTLKDRLEKEKYKILDFSKDSEWTAVLDAYNKAKDSTSKRFISNSSEVQLKDLKDSCKSALSGKEEDDSLFDKARKWCVVPRNISERLSDLSLSPLKTTDDTEDKGDKSKWEAIGKQYESKGNNKIAGLSLTTSNADNWKSIRDKCKVFFSQDPWSNDYDTNLEVSKDWCVAEVIKS
ncbi:hypothetical protein MHF_0588 [Mycoplasma haemofelis Ohio2]|uniref:Uncharacterized protein n=1 Tax=Mycoplasma haemofelis (strain Ohio2) TaxID=859194 RepID=F6FI12_MYCHI|nr:hypothetical protein MHF_0588 [Mycoplasma haemofelis Ohio2]